MSKDDQRLNITFNAAILNVVAIFFLPRYDLLKHESKWHCLHYNIII